MGYVEQAIVKYADLVAPIGYLEIRRGALLLLDSACDESRGWYGPKKPGCKRDKDKTAAKRQAASKARKPRNEAESPGWEGKLAKLQQLGENPIPKSETYTAGQILRSKLSDESQALLLAGIGAPMPIGFENKQGAVFATPNNAGSFYDKSEWFEETRSRYRFKTQKGAIAYAKANQSDNGSQREDVIIAPVKTGSGTVYIPFRRIMNAGQYQDFDPRPEHAETVAKSKKVSYRNMKQKAKVLQRMNEYDEMAWNISRKASQGIDRFKRLENAAVEAIFWTGNRSFGALATHLEKDLTKPHGPHAATGKGGYVEQSLKSTAKLLRSWEASPDKVPRRVQELIKGRVEVDGATDQQADIGKAKKAKEIEDAKAKAKAYDQELSKMFSDIKQIENDHGEALSKLRFSRFVEQKRANGKISDADYAKFVKDGKILGEKDRIAAEKVEQQINEIKERPWAEP